MWINGSFGVLEIYSTKLLSLKKTDLFCSETKRLLHEETD